MRAASSMPAGWVNPWSTRSRTAAGSASVAPAESARKSSASAICRPYGRTYGSKEYSGRSLRVAGACVMGTDSRVPSNSIYPCQRLLTPPQVNERAHEYRDVLGLRDIVEVGLIVPH